MIGSTVEWRTFPGKGHGWKIVNECMYKEVEEDIDARSDERKQQELRKDVYGGENYNKDDEKK